MGGAGRGGANQEAEEWSSYAMNRPRSGGGRPTSSRAALARGSIQSQCPAGCLRTGSPFLRADLTSTGPRNTFFQKIGHP